jgi:hypothetical protein
MEALDRPSAASVWAAVRGLATSLPAGALWTAAFLVTMRTLDVNATAGALAVATLLVPITHGLAVVGVTTDSVSALPADAVALCRRLPWVVAGWLGAVAAWLAVAALLVATVGGTAGAIDAAVRYLQYSSGAVPPSGPAMTMERFVLVTGTALSALAVATLPVQYVFTLLVRGRGPREALAESAGLLRHHPRAAVRHWLCRTVLAAIPLSLVALAVRTGAVGFEYELTRVIGGYGGTRELRGFDGVAFYRYGALALGVATVVAAVRTRLTVRTLDRLGDRDASGTPEGRLGRLLAPRTLAVVTVALLLVSGVGAGVRITDQTPTPDVSQSVADVEDPGRLLAIAAQNRNRTSHEHTVRLQIRSEQRTQPVNGTAVLERDSTFFDGYGVYAYERETRELGVYSESRDDGTEPFTLGYYVTDVGWYGTRVPVRGLVAEPVYRPDSGPSRANMDTLWEREAAWNATLYGGEPEDDSRIPPSQLLAPTPADEANLTVQSRNESHVVLAITDDRAARNYDRGDGAGGAFYRGEGSRRTFVATDSQPAVDAVRNDSGVEQATTLHDASVRIVVDTATGRAERITTTENYTRVELASENDSRLRIDRVHVERTTTYREYDNTTVEPPAGVPAPFGRLTVDSLFGLLLDYLSY